MEQNRKLVQAFREAAEKVSAVVSEVQTMEEALSYAVALCDHKEVCRLMVSGCEAPLSPKAENLCDQKQKKYMAAPVLSEEHAQLLATLCERQGIELLREGLRSHLAGIDVGLTMADFGIADTGTLVIDSSNEEVRLATMVSEVHIAVLPITRIHGDAFELEAYLGQLMSDGPNYTAFVTGASRTADIERVLALGVHGPLELHVLLLS